MRDPLLARLERVFQAAADLPAAEREAYLDRECAGEPILRARAAALLAELERGGSLAPPTLAEDEVPLAEGPGTVIGRYKLLESIGEGGFGVVYMAEQIEPVVRRVALKIIKLGMDTKEVVARFEAERQALALMDHPNIARVLDGGATESGRPYFVMELVRGVSITEYCDTNNLTTRERLELFVPVCLAVQHAHQKGVIHRDIKPSNVMVTLHDGVPVPKVIDFGVAKAMHGRLTERTLFTAYQRFIGTPAYMSPEQAELSGLDVDTRADIYSLGVLLYELLTGTTPFDARDLFEKGLAAIQKTIREEPPQRPSLRISTTGDATLARRRRSDLPALSKLLRGDLDWIVLKCLEKERGRRYETAQSLAAEIQRHLANEPVLAGPPSAIYRLSKWIGRNRVAFAASVLVLVVLLAGIIGTSYGMFAARHERDLAVDARRTAESEAARTRAVTDFLVATLELADPGVALDPSLSVATLLQRAASKVNVALRDQPAAEARVRGTIGRAYKALGENELAEHNLLRAVELGESVPDFDEAELYASLWDLTHVKFDLNRGDAMLVAQAARRVAHAHVRRLHPALGEALERFIEAVNATGFAGDPEAKASLPERFAASVRESDLALQRGDPLWPMVADTWMAAGYTLWYGPYEALTEDYWRRALAIHRRELAPGDPRVGETLSLLVGVLDRQGRGAEAEGELRTAVETMRASLPPTSPQLAFAESMLGANLTARGRFEEAEPLLLRGHDVIRTAIADPTSFAVADSLGRVVALYDAWNRPERVAAPRAELAELCAQGEFLLPWPIARLAYPPEEADLVAALDGLLELSSGATDPSAATLVERVQVGLRRDHPTPDAPSALTGRVLLESAQQGHVADPTTLRAVLEEGLARQEESAVPNSYEVAEGHARLARLLVDTDRAAASRHAQEAWRLLQPRLDDRDWAPANTRIGIARGLVALGMLREAEAVLRPSYATLVEQFGADSSNAAAAGELLVSIERQLGLPATGAGAPGTARPSTPVESSDR